MEQFKENNSDKSAETDAGTGTNTEDSLSVSRDAEESPFAENSDTETASAQEEGTGKELSENGQDSPELKEPTDELRSVNKLILDFITEHNTKLDELKKINSELANENSVLKTKNEEVTLNYESERNLLEYINDQRRNLEKERDHLDSQFNKASSRERQLISDVNDAILDVLSPKESESYGASRIAVIPFEKRGDGFETEYTHTYLDDNRKLCRVSMRFENGKGEWQDGYYQIMVVHNYFASFSRDGEEPKIQPKTETETFPSLVMAEKAAKTFIEMHKL